MTSPSKPEKLNLKLNLQDARQALLQGSIVATPTSTFYALAADIRCIETLNALHILKRRPQAKPGLVLVSSIGAVEELVVGALSPTAKLFMNHFWPGPLTLILPNPRTHLSLKIRTPQTIAVRHDPHPLLLELFDNTLTAISGTSANHSGDPPLSSGAAVSRLFFNASRYTGHIGTTSFSSDLPSTILDLSRPSPKISREGRLQRLEIEIFLKQHGVDYDYL